MVLAAKGAGDGDDGWAGAVRELLQRHSDPMYLDARRKVDSSTALHLAVDGDACQARVVAGLVLRDANHAQKNKHGFTVLECACWRLRGLQPVGVVIYVSLLGGDFALCCLLQGRGRNARALRRTQSSSFSLTAPSTPWARERHARPSLLRMRTRCLGRRR